jgi:predicted nucleic acid-binding Zn ribbon protein
MQAIKDLLPNVMAQLQTPEKLIRTRLVAEWPSVAGPKIAAHTKPLLRNGELCVWVDQPALAYELSQKHKQSLLKRAQMSLGETTVKSIRFYVGQIR